MRNYIYEEESRELRHMRNEVHKLEDDYFRERDLAKKDLIYRRLQRKRRELWQMERAES